MTVMPRRPRRSRIGSLSYPRSPISRSAASGAGGRARRAGRGRSSSVGVDERDFRRAGRGDMYSQRNTLAVDHHHPLRTLAPLGLADVGAPFFAEANEPSMNVFSQRSRPRASSWPRKARHIRSQVPSSSHCRRRRQHVDPLGYPSGRSRQRAPVLSTQRMPSTTSRWLTRGRPPFARTSRTREMRFDLGPLRVGQPDAALAHAHLRSSVIPDVDEFVQAQNRILNGF